MHCRGLKKETHFNQKPEQTAARVSSVTSLSHILTECKERASISLSPHTKTSITMDQCCFEVFAGKVPCIAGHYR